MVWPALEKACRFYSGTTTGEPAVLCRIIMNPQEHHAWQWQLSHFVVSKGHKDLSDDAGIVGNLGF
jgi:hypothetical protein